MGPIQALQILYDNAIQSRNLPPAALPELQKLAKIIEDALIEIGDLRKNIDALIPNTNLEPDSEE